MNPELTFSDKDLLDMHKKGQIAIHDLPPHLKWYLPHVVYTVDKPYRDPGIDFRDDPGMTDPSAAAECDVNLIIKRATQTGVLPGVDTAAVFADISDLPSYQEARQLVINAENQFASLDAHVRKRFDNDPAKFLEFMSDPTKAQEAVDLGLATIRPKANEELVLDELRAANELSRRKPKTKTPSPADPDSDDA